MSLTSREPFLRGDTVNLYAVEREDLDFFRDLRNMPEVRVPYGHPYTPVSTDDMEAEYDREGGEVRHTFLVGDTDDNRVGQVMLVYEAEGFSESGVAEIRAFLHPDYHSGGYGSESLYLLICHGFQQMNLHKVWARVLTTNGKSLALCQKLGLKQEGLMKDMLYTDGEYVDMLYAGITCSEWNDRFDIAIGDRIPSPEVLRNGKQPSPVSYTLDSEPVMDSETLRTESDD